jgi:hypothetical protein
MFSIHPNPKTVMRRTKIVKQREREREREQGKN